MESASGGDISVKDKKRRLCVHFSVDSKTVTIPGSCEEGECRGGGAGHFTSLEEELVKDCRSCSLSIRDEAAEHVRFYIAKGRRQSAPAVSSNRNKIIRRVHTLNSEQDEDIGTKTNKIVCQT